MPIRVSTPRSTGGREPRPIRASGAAQSNMRASRRKISAAHSSPNWPLGIWRIPPSAPALGECAGARAAASETISANEDALEENHASLSCLALALALCGEISQTQSRIVELKQRYPQGTLVHWMWPPVIEAAVELRRGDGNKALERLRPVARYEAAAEFWPQFLRGHAYLLLGKAAEAEIEFPQDPG